MLHVVYANNGTFVTSDIKIAQAAEQGGVKVVSRNDFKSFDEAKAAANDASEAEGELYVATYHPNMRPRYDIVRAPKVGDKVSKEFNGDAYPEGEIVKVSKTLKRVETDTGEVFYRKKETGSWVSKGTWLLVPGHIDKRNPHF